MLEKIKRNAQTAYEVFKAAGKEYGEDRVGRMSAAVSYRAIFAMAPLFLVAVFVFGLVLGSNASAQAEILDAVEQFAGSEVADAMETVLGSVEASGNTAGVVGFALLLWTASSLFMELQNDLNDIFHVPYERTTGVVAFIRKRGIGFLFALGLGVVLIAVWGLNFIWNLLDGVFPEDFGPVHSLIGFLTPLVSLIVLPFVIALAFQVLSRVRVRWRAVWWGSFFTSVAFLAAAYGTGLYFRFGGTLAATVAGSIFIILLLAFILSTVFLFGAEVTKVYADYLDRGEVTRPNEKARRSTGPESVVGEPEPSVPLAAVFAFLGGLFLGWRRRS
jgi:membrane protein